MYHDLFKLDDKYTIQADSITFALRHVTTETKIWRKTGEEITKEHEQRWFHPTLAGILERYVKEVGRDVKSWDSYLEKLDKISSQIAEFKRTFIIDERPVRLIDRQNE